VNEIKTQPREIMKLLASDEGARTELSVMIRSGGGEGKSWQSH